MRRTATAKAVDEIGKLQAEIDDYISRSCLRVLVVKIRFRQIPFPIPYFVVKKPRKLGLESQAEESAPGRNGVGH